MTIYFFLTNFTLLVGGSFCILRLFPIMRLHRTCLSPVVIPDYASDSADLSAPMSRVAVITRRARTYTNAPPDER